MVYVEVEVKVDFSFSASIFEVHISHEISLIPEMMDVSRGTGLRLYYHESTWLVLIVRLLSVIFSNFPLV